MILTNVIVFYFGLNSERQLHKEVLGCGYTLSYGHLLQGEGGRGIDHIMDNVDFCKFLFVPNGRSVMSM